MEARALETGYAAGCRGEETLALQFLNGDFGGFSKFSEENTS